MEDRVQMQIILLENCSAHKNSQRSAVSAINIGGMLASITAWANDFGFETYFERQVKAHGNEGDILFLISTGGGNLENGASTCLIKAAVEAKKENVFNFFSG